MGLVPGLVSRRKLREEFTARCTELPALTVSDLKAAVVHLVFNYLAILGHPVQQTAEGEFKVMYIIALIKRAHTDGKLKPGISEDVWEDCDDQEADDATPAFRVPRIDVYADHARMLHYSDSLTEAGRLKPNRKLWALVRNIKNISTEGLRGTFESGKSHLLGSNVAETHK